MLYLFHVVEEKTQKPLFFCKFEETFKEQSFRIHSIYSSSRSKIEGKGEDELADPDSQESWSNICCRQSLARKSREISVSARYVMQMWLCWRVFPHAPCLAHLGSCPLKTYIAPRGIWVKISLLTLLRERRNSDLAKDIFRQEQHLNRLCNWYELYCWSNFTWSINRSLIFTRFVCLSHYTGRTPQSIFSFISQNENFSEWSAHFKFVSGEFSTLFAEIWRGHCPIIRQKNGVGEFSFFASFKSYNYFSDESACYINSQSLTACQKQTRQVIKISRHRFLKKGIKKT